MRNGKRGRFTLEFKQGAVRLVEPGVGGGSAQPGSGGTDLGQLDQASPGRKVEGRLRQAAGDGRADGDQPFASGVGASDDGARHSAAPNQAWDGDLT